jgi:hypothetical protein
VSGTYSEYHYYSPLTDTDMVRVSMFNERGHEFFVTMEVTYGKASRKKRADAIDALQQAIYAGKPPGEVRIK